MDLIIYVIEFGTVYCSGLSITDGRCSFYRCFNPSLLLINAAGVNIIPCHSEIFGQKWDFIEMKPFVH